MQNTSSLIVSPTAPLALPQLPIAVRAATLGDLPFIDELQKRHTLMVGWMPTKQLEGKINAGQCLIAEEPPPQPSPGVPGEGARVGYVIGHDQYFKRDDVGIIYQMNVVPGRQRSLIGATLLKALFDRAAYGCRLFCCWCAQDIAANHFWEAMGFVPLAFRTGGLTKGKGKTPRVHIFWQRRIREGDVSTPFWFPAQTSGGSIREDRVVLPMPVGSHWSDAKPMVLPSEVREQKSEISVAGRKQLPGSRAKAKAPAEPDALRMGGLRFPAPAPPAAKLEPAKRQPRPKAKNDPKLVAAVRELRDRYLERVNGAESLLSGNARYEVYGRIGSVATGAKERRALPAA